jgi:hypothetical protein
MGGILRQTAVGISITRAAFGVLMLAEPRRIGEAWIGEPGTSVRVGVLIRSVAARDVALGGGAAVALLRGENHTARAFLAGQAAADVGDLAGTLAARDRLPAKGFKQVMALAGLSAVLAGATAALLD